MGATKNHSENWSVVVLEPPSVILAFTVYFCLFSDYLFPVLHMCLLSAAVKTAAWLVIQSFLILNVLHVQIHRERKLNHLVKKTVRQTHLLTETSPPAKKPEKIICHLLLKLHT